MNEASTIADLPNAQNPLLKWPGGKRFLACKLAPILRALGCRPYFEPFAGGAAVFFALQPHAARISDTNDALINLYQVVKHDPVMLLRRLKRAQYTNSLQHYLQVRSSKPRTAVARAARIYFLMRLSFNGIYRENYSGQFNVPYGWKTHLSSYDEDAVVEASRLLQRAELFTRDFRESCLDIPKNGIAYFDPPYTTTHDNNGFIKYNRRLFSFADQIDLAEHCKRLTRQGTTVIVSNAHHRSIRDLYRGFLKEITISRHSKIAATPQHRVMIKEALFASHDVAHDIEAAFATR